MASTAPEYRLKIVHVSADPPEATGKLLVVSFDTPLEHPLYLYPPYTVRSVTAALFPAENPISMVGSVTDEIKQRVDVVEVISRYTELKRAGSIYKGLCPFHGERTPSFVVFPHSGTWHCFGACGTGGDVISFVMRKENLDFREAVEMLAKQAGIEIGRPRRGPQRPTASANLRRQRGRRRVFRACSPPPSCR